MADEDDAPRVTYPSYLRLLELLELQTGERASTREISSDETHFIVVHQVFELWFKLVINELRGARDLLVSDPVPEENIPRAVHTLGRVTEIFRLMADQWKVMETLTPQDFLLFRDHLGTASGFESWQMREIEYLIGLDNSERGFEMDPLAHYRKLALEVPDYQYGLECLEKVIAEPSLVDVLSRWLARTPIQGSFSGDEDDEEIVDEFVDQYIEAMVTLNDEGLARAKVHSSVEENTLKARFDFSVNQAREFLKPHGEASRARAGLLFIEVYRELPLLAWPRLLIDSVVELEESMVLFRTHHARMVERIIGRRVGTGGSSGVDYLDSTTQYRVFKDLWGVRTILIKRDALPPILRPEVYGFSSES